MLAIFRTRIRALFQLPPAQNQIEDEQCRIISLLLWPIQFLITSIDVPAITNAFTFASALGGIEPQSISEWEALEDGDAGLYLKNKDKGTVRLLWI
jgi:hypothetical protein